MIKSKSRNPNVHKIALTGGPGGGKSTAAELFKREYRDFITLVPEVATLLFKGGFPRVESPLILESIQASIFHVQLNIEDAYCSLYPNNTLLCDRGTVDGGAYWPRGADDFFKTMGTTLNDELMSYDAVIFFETAAAGGLDIDLGNPIRNEDQRRAIEIDLRLKDLWSKHPNFVYIKNEPSFLKKTMEGIKSIDHIIRTLKKI